MNLKFWKNKHRGMKVIYSRPNASVIEDGRYIEVTLRFSKESKRQRQVAVEVATEILALADYSATSIPTNIDNLSDLSTNPPAQS